MANTKTKIKKLIGMLDNPEIDYVSSVYTSFIFHDSGLNLDDELIDVDGEKSVLGIQDIINNVGKHETVYLSSEVRQLLNSEYVQNLIKDEPKQRTVRNFQGFNLDKISVGVLSNDTVDCLNFMFKNMEVIYGFPIQLQYLLPLFREYNNNQELRKKDLSIWLIHTGVFVKTPTALYTYINSVPLSKIEKQFPEQ